MCSWFVLRRPRALFSRSAGRPSLHGRPVTRFVPDGLYVCREPGSRRYIGRVPGESVE